MVKHIILWQIKPEYTGDKKNEILKAIQEGLENLKGEVPGLIDIKVYINALDTSNTDVMLDATLENYDALKAYAVNSKHVEVKDTKIVPYTCVRSCFDYEI